MPLTPDMRRSIDQIRDYLFGGGYPDPVSNAEQLAFLFFFYLVEGIDAENMARAKVLKQPYESMFKGSWTLRNPLNAPSKGETTIPKDRFRWSVWATRLSIWSAPAAHCVRTTLSRSNTFVTSPRA